MVVLITCLGMPPDLVFQLLQKFKISAEKAVSELMKIKADNVYVMAPADLLSIFGQWLVLKVEIISMECPDKETLEQLRKSICDESKAFAAAHLPHCRDILVPKVSWTNAMDVKVLFSQVPAGDEDD